MRYLIIKIGSRYYCDYKKERFQFCVSLSAAKIFRENLDNKQLLTTLNRLHKMGYSFLLFEVLEQKVMQ